MLECRLNLAVSIGCLGIGRMTGILPTAIPEFEKEKQVRKFVLGLAAIGLVASPLAAQAVSRQAAPVEDANGLAGQGSLFFLLGIAVVAAAVVLLPEDSPASP